LLYTSSIQSGKIDSNGAKKKKIAEVKNIQMPENRMVRPKGEKGDLALLLVKAFCAFHSRNQGIKASRT
jgi:hypothetical protein